MSPTCTWCLTHDSCNWSSPFCPVTRNVKCSSDGACQLPVASTWHCQLRTASTVHFYTTVRRQNERTNQRSMFCEAYMQLETAWIDRASTRCFLMRLTGWSRTSSSSSIVVAVEAEKRQDGSISSEVCQSPWAWLHRPQSEALHGKIIMMMNEKALAKSEQGLLASSLKLQHTFM